MQCLAPLNTLNRFLKRLILKIELICPKMTQLFSERVLLFSVTIRRGLGFANYCRKIRIYLSAAEFAKLAWSTIFLTDESTNKNLLCTRVIGQWSIKRYESLQPSLLLWSWRNLTRGRFTFRLSFTCSFMHLLLFTTYSSLSLSPLPSLSLGLYPRATVCCFRLHNPRCW